MIKVTLVDCKGSRNEGRKRMENLGLGYLAAVLEKKGYQVEIIDANYFDFIPDRIVARIIKQQPLVAGFSLFFNNAAETIAVIKRLRSLGLKSHITLGGHHATFNCREILVRNPEVDSILRGEGELAMAELVDRVSANQDWHDMDNLACIGQPGHEQVNKCRPLINDLDFLPFPSRRPYHDAIEREGTASVISSRGCFGHCSFCSIHPFNSLAKGKPWRPRSPENVVDEIELLVKDSGIGHLVFADDDFFGVGRWGKERALAIGNILAKRRLDVTFIVSCRPDNLDEEVLRQLKEAGLVCVDIGIESWIPRQLALYNKKVTAGQNRRAIQLLSRLGMEYRVYLIPFDPYVTLDELRQNAEEAQGIGARHLLDMFAFSHIMVLKGAPLEATLRQDNLLKFPSDRPYYEGSLEYAYHNPEVEHLFLTWYSIQKEYAELDQRAKKLFDLKSDNFAEKSFSLNLQLALKQNILDLFTSFTHSWGVKGGKGKDRLWLHREIESLVRDLDIIAEAKKEGRFRRFERLHLNMGKYPLDYPPLIIPELKPESFRKYRGSR